MAPNGYSDFLSFLFDRPEPKGGAEWYWEEDTTCPGAEDEQHLVRLMGYLFRNCRRDLANYSDSQVAMGLEYLTHNAVSDLVYTLISKEVPETVRAAAISSMKHLYSDCFAQRCGPMLGHLNEGDGNRLNAFCYMLWDVTPLNGFAEGSDDPSRLAAILDVLAHALKIGHPACSESALHGLGHMKWKQPGPVIALIDGFLAQGHRGQPRWAELEAYARAARTGLIQ